MVMMLAAVAVVVGNFGKLERRLVLVPVRFFYLRIRSLSSVLSQSDCLMDVTPGLIGRDSSK